MFQIRLAPPSIGFGPARVSANKRIGSAYAALAIEATLRELKTLPADGDHVATLEAAHVRLDHVIAAEATVYKLHRDLCDAAKILGGRPVAIDGAPTGLHQAALTCVAMDTAIRRSMPTADTGLKATLMNVAAARDAMAEELQTLSRRKGKLDAACRRMTGRALSLTSDPSAAYRINRAYHSPEAWNLDGPDHPDARDLQAMAKVCLATEHQTEAQRKTATRKAARARIGRELEAIFDV